MTSNEIKQRLKEYFSSCSDMNLVSVCLTGSSLTKPLSEVGDIDLAFILKIIDHESLVQLSEYISDLEKIFNKKIGFSVLSEDEITRARDTGYFLIEGRSANYADDFKNCESVYGASLGIENIEFNSDPISSYSSLNRVFHNLVKAIVVKNHDIKTIEKLITKAIKIVNYKTFQDESDLKKHRITNQDFTSVKDIFSNKKQGQQLDSKEISSILNFVNNLRTYLAEDITKQSIFSYGIRPNNLPPETKFIFISGVNLSGKSTVSRKLAGILNYNLIHLDSIKDSYKSVYDFLEMNTVDAHQVMPHLEDLNLSHDRKLILSYQQISNILMYHLRLMLKPLAVKGKSCIIEGLHLDPVGLKYFTDYFESQGVEVQKYYLSTDIHDAYQNLEQLKKENAPHRDFKKFEYKISKDNPNNVWLIDKHFKESADKYGWQIIKNPHGYLDQTIFDIYSKIISFPR